MPSVVTQGQCGEEKLGKNPTDCGAKAALSAHAVYVTKRIDRRNVRASHAGHARGSARQPISTSYAQAPTSVGLQLCDLTFTGYILEHDTGSVIP